MRWIEACACVLLGALSTTSVGADEEVEVRGFGIQIVDQDTEVGVPLVELTTVDDVTWITDNLGCVAIDEPQLFGQTLFLRIDAPGYDAPKDGFGIAGIRVQPKLGKLEIITLRRVQPAVRLGRVTGRDRYRDSIRLGPLEANETLPEDELELPPEGGQVVGQDSVQTAVYSGRMHWFWGDTNRLSYPLGLYRTAGAVSTLPLPDEYEPFLDIHHRYYTDDTGFARAMVDVPDKEGVVWIHGVCTVQDDAGRERMVAQYSRRPGLSDPLEHGLVMWNDDREIFEVLQRIDLSESWRMLSDHPIHITDNETDYLCFGNPFPVTRVPATLAAIQNRMTYQSWSCRANSDQPNLPREQLESSVPERDAAGRIQWAWKSGPPVTQADERRWVRQGLMTIDECRFLPLDRTEAAPTNDTAHERIVQMHSGTVRFNTSRKRWVMIAIEHAWDESSPSFLGEVFYSEAESPQGPFKYAVKIATHPGQSFYNPCHHDVYDLLDGRFIHFEGTYCNTFTKSPPKPRYNYNQLMYRLDLADPMITRVFGE